MSTLFNQAQFSTFEDARALVAEMQAFGQNFGHQIGEGVRPESTDNSKSGIYDLSKDFLPGPAGFEPPHSTNEKGEPTYWLHLRFQNGREGVNVGLVLDRLKRYPYSHGYVFASLAQEVAQPF